MGTDPVSVARRAASPSPTFGRRSNYILHGMPHPPLTNILLVGSGGREHALAWKLSRSPRVGTVYVAPGNAGTENNVSIPQNDTGALADFAEANDCFTVVGPEAPLAEGIYDVFARRGLKLFGPSRDAARLEYSKAWAKSFMSRHGIPTARYQTFDNYNNARKYIESADHNVVVKADGLAAGKGVIVCPDKETAFAAIQSMMHEGRFGDAGRRVVIEENLQGAEASYIAICDGTTSIPMATSQDHKRLLDGDRGPNTGGMGAYSPADTIDDEMARKIHTDIVQKTVTAMKNEKSPFTGFLYAGIMISDGKPYVLEYNVRMGDPECQPIVMRMDFDLFEYMESAVSGSLASMGEPSWSGSYAACVVMAAKGYPDKYRIRQGIQLPQTPEHTMIFHAGTRRIGNETLTNGGRVAGVTSVGADLDAALRNAYDTVGKVSGAQLHYRTDIGRRAV